MTGLSAFESNLLLKKDPSHGKPRLEGGASSFNRERDVGFRSVPFQICSSFWRPQSSRTNGIDARPLLAAEGGSGHQRISVTRLRATRFNAKAEARKP